VHKVEQSLGSDDSGTGIAFGFKLPDKPDSDSLHGKMYRAAHGLHHLDKPPDTEHACLPVIVDPSQGDGYNKVAALFQATRCSAQRCCRIWACMENAVQDHAVERFRIRNGLCHRIETLEADPVPDRGRPGEKSLLRAGNICRYSIDSLDD